MYLDYYDLDQATQAHRLLCEQKLEVTFFQNKQSDRHADQREHEHRKGNQHEFD